MAVVVQSGDGNSDYKLVVNSDGSINTKLEATPTIDIGDVQIQAVTATGQILPVLGVDDGSGHAKLSVTVA